MRVTCVLQFVLDLLRMCRILGQFIESQLSLDATLAHMTAGLHFDLCLLIYEVVVIS